ncbi:hypothetical protein BDA99DRAFT_533761 [Phascolomyces articulosus]|uniref:Uncharacterized protein n=1 Tax=Phascolomyces articulosus TaxID=60185 RepID=A0AAD5PI40_9FUNG|nr:hypothetical protein BDA99DRAFT_533761 [Phascolomyces articulosus]
MLPNLLPTCSPACYPICYLPAPQSTIHLLPSARQPATQLAPQPATHLLANLLGGKLGSRLTSSVSESLTSFPNLMYVHKLTKSFCAQTSTNSDPKSASSSSDKCPNDFSLVDERKKKSHRNRY